MKRAFVFPGQGSQAVGMGRDLANAFSAARYLLAEVDEALSQRLSQLMFEGPESDLILTENAQPALLAASLAVVRVLEEEGGLVFGRHVAYVAGHSLGEYSALAAARALSVGTAARLVKLRGRMMQKAVPPGEGAMAALLGLDVEAARRIAAAAVSGPDEVCVVANDNAPGQVVVSGHRHAVERAIAIARERQACRSIVLPVSAPFHSPLMAPAAEIMQKALDEVALRSQQHLMARCAPPCQRGRLCVAVDLAAQGDRQRRRKRALPRDGGGRGDRRDRDWSRACWSG
jgi:[acyl-carrier-protein] S-malonyltransferase